MATPINSMNLPESTLDDWMGEFWRIYEHHDRQRDLIEMWAMAAEDASTAGQGIREADPAGTLRSIAHASCWCLSFVARLFHDGQLPPQFRISKHFPELHSLADVVWFKYPAICPRCGKGSCICPILVEAAPVEREMEAARRKANRPETLADWESHFSRIYDVAHLSRSLEELGFHYEEEVGEVFRAIRRLSVNVSGLSPDEVKARQVNLVEEIADVVSWTVSVVRKLAKQAEEIERYAGAAHVLSKRFSLASVLWEAYSSRQGLNCLACPICNYAPCSPECDTAS